MNNFFLIIFFFLSTFDEFSVVALLVCFVAAELLFGRNYCSNILTRWQFSRTGNWTRSEVFHQKLVLVRFPFDFDACVLLLLMVVLLHTASAAVWLLVLAVFDAFPTSTLYLYVSQMVFCSFFLITFSQFSSRICVCIFRRDSNLHAFAALHRYFVLARLWWMKLGILFFDFHLLFLQRLFFFHSNTFFFAAAIFFFIFLLPFFVCRELSYFIFLMVQINEVHQKKNRHSTQLVNTEL